MRQWWLLATRNWLAKPGWASGIVVAVALGVATVVWVTSSYKSVEQSISNRIIERWIGRSHVIIESTLGHWGVIDQSMADTARAIEGVEHVTARLRRRMHLSVGADNHQADRPAPPEIAVDAVGIQPETEYGFRGYEIAGQALRAGEHGTAVIEKETARQLGVGIGDRIGLARDRLAEAVPLHVIGLFEARRVARFQKPMVLLELSELQTLVGAEGSVSVVDLMLADPTPANLKRVADVLREKIREANLGYQVSTATARLEQLNEARRQTEFALTMVASVSLLTALFIITTTMSMGMVERIRQVGVLRCVGVTRRQLAGAVLAEVGPLGAAGMCLGVPLGLLMTYGSSLAAADYIQDVIVSRRGIAVALVGGLLTTLGGGLVPAIQAGRVSPLAATRPQARPPNRGLPFVAFLVGAALVATHSLMVAKLDPVHWTTRSVVLTGTAMLYLGYALMTPLAVQAIGGLAVQVAARLLRLKPALLNDQVGRATWRGAGICCGLMVGLSLLIGVVVHAESIRSGWDFPKRIAQAFVWTSHRVPSSCVETVRRISGVRECTVVNDFLVEMGESRSRLFKLFKVRSTFVAGEPDVFLKMAKLEFLEGEREDAEAKLKKGGYILLPPESSRAFDLHLGDKVTMSASGGQATFEVAGVVQSPALDIAVSYFQAESYMMVAAANSVLGTLQDAKRHFGVDSISLFLLNFSLPQTEPPELFTQDAPPATVDDAFMITNLLRWGERLENDRDRMEELLPLLKAWAVDPSQPLAFSVLAPYRLAMLDVVDRWKGRTAQQRWEMYCDRLILQRIVTAIDRPNAIVGSLRELKQQIDDDIRAATVLLATIPVVALLVAAVGVGNLMTTNVLNRTRELGVLRSVGATKWQIARLVLGEAVVLSGIGCIAGFALGLHAAISMNILTERAIGFAPPLALPGVHITIGIVLTVGVCIIAGVLPARRASRSDVVTALRAT